MKKNLFPPTSQRVLLRTDPKINEDIRNQTLRNLNIFKGCSADEIAERIQMLNLEWDTERVLDVNAAMLIVLSSYLGIKTSRFWFVLTGTVGVFMLQHAFYGWCPPIPFIRKWGVRTADEINSEKIALKMMRGDFGENTSSNIADLLNIADKQ